MPEEIKAALSQATEDLLYMSESDEPFEVVDWKESGGTFDIRKALSPKNPDVPVEIVSLEDFFRDLTQEQDWHGKDEKIAVDRYRNLLRVIRCHLPDAKVFRIGRIQVDIFIVGRTREGDWTGVRTKAVET